MTRADRYSKRRHDEIIHHFTTPPVAETVPVAVDGTARVTEGCTSPFARSLVFGPGRSWIEASCPRWRGRDALDPGAATNRMYTGARGRKGKPSSIRTRPGRHGPSISRFRVLRLRPRVRKLIASATCSSSMPSDCARSAIVRATLSTRSRARADRCSFSIARARSLRLLGPIAQCLRSSPTASPLVRLACPLHLPRPGAATRSRTAADGSAGSGIVVVTQAGHVDMQIDAIEQRSRNTRTVACDLLRGAPAGSGRVSERPAWARVHRGDEAGIGRGSLPGGLPARS